MNRTSSVNWNLRIYHFFLCVGEENFFLEGGIEKSRFDKGGNKVELKYSKGERNYECVRGGE